MINWIKKYFRSKTSEETGEDIIDRRMKENNEYHYFFTHYILRKLFYEQPLKTIEILNSSDKLEFLGYVLEYCYESIESDSPKLSLDDFDTHYFEFKEYKCLLIVMPKPKGATEAYMVCLVMKENENEVIKRYITLEKGIDMKGMSYPVLCEWGEDGSHGNMGEGPSPKKSEFIKKIKEML